MALYSAFIGVDKHRDLNGRDLTGARRDATALWALFSDSIPDMTASLIVDAEATVERIRRTLDETLGVAGPDDTVVITFSVHGTHDHRLVAHDTSASDLHATTIPMEEVVSQLRRARAGAVLCVLDCCFSGVAPARVLEDSPVPRDAVSPLLEVVGKGRVLIAASNVDEPAYEFPGSGHGILTKAIIDVLRGEAEQVSLATAVDKITGMVRAEAERIGVVQTPVFFNYVEGGLVLPPLKAGERFFRAFPELGGIRVGRDISELVAFGLPAEVLSAWAAQFAGGLNDLQLEAVNEQRVLDGASLLVVAPTSAGKRPSSARWRPRSPSPRGRRPPSCCPTGRSSTRSTSSSPRSKASVWACAWCAARATTRTRLRSSSAASTTWRCSPTRCSSAWPSAARRCSTSSAWLCSTRRRP